MLVQQDNPEKIADVVKCRLATSPTLPFKSNFTKLPGNSFNSKRKCPYRSTIKNNVLVPQDNSKKIADVVKRRLATSPDLPSKSVFTILPGNSYNSKRTRPYLFTI